jgi:ParB-like chromosome segregation protein Spo0J
MSKLKIEYRNTKDLIPYVNNSRTHSDEQVLQIASSIKEFGFTNPILIDGEKGIIAGHGRLKAAKILDIDLVPVIELQNLTTAQKKAYIIADNKLALNAGWDIELLHLEMDGLREFNYDLNLTGFSESDLARLEDDIDLLRMKNMENDGAPKEHNDDDVKSNSDELYPLSIMIDHDQRETIFAALRKAKQEHDLENSSQAIWAICKEYINE